MMALKGVGNYDGEDYKNTALAGDYQQKIAYHKTEIVNRLKNHIKSGDFALFYANKYTYMWGDGTFYATGVLSNPVNRNILHEFILPGGQYFTSFAYITQASYLFIFLLMFFSPFLTRQKRNLPYYFLLLVMVGYFLFFSVWEVASRQLIYIYPIMLLIASYSLQSLASNIKLIKFNQQIFTKIHQCFHIHHKKLHKS